MSLSVPLDKAVLDSPGSSVFDLPAHPPETVAVSRLAPLPPVPPTTRDGYASTCSYHEKVSFASHIVISGGTGGNAICSAFENACFVLPVSDDGGSSSEIIRVLGGPSVGDIRSRLVRLIPPAPPNSPLHAIRNLLAYRLPSSCSAQEAREQWRDIVEGRSDLWKGIPNDRKETIRGFLVYFESELLKRAHKNFDFRNGSIGNYFIAAAQGFFRSLPSAIFLFSSITNSQAHILPVIVTNHTVTISAELEDGERLVGQCEISHPVATSTPTLDVEDVSVDGIGSLAELQPQNIMYQQGKDGAFEPLPAKISRLYYINSYGMEIHPSSNPEFLANLHTKDILVYSCGSFWTSIIPCLALRGVAPSIAGSRSLQAKVLLLNAENDRETSGYTAIDYIHAIVRTLNTNYSVHQDGLGNANTAYPASAFVTDLVYLKGSKVKVDEDAIRKLGIQCAAVHPVTHGGAQFVRFDAETVRAVLAKIWAERTHGHGLLALVIIFGLVSTVSPTCALSLTHSALSKIAVAMSNKTPTSIVLSSQQPSVLSQPHIYDNDISTHTFPTTELSTDKGHALPSIHPPLRRMSEEVTRTQEVVAQLRNLALSGPGDIQVTVEDLGAHNAKGEDPALGNSEEEEANSESEALQKDSTLRPSYRVTFRPRVRITSGLNRLRQSDSDTYHILSATSSRSCSPSSSISAPLRFHSEEPVSRPGWGTLGQRVSLLARRGEHKRRFRERMKHHERMLKNFQGSPHLLPPSGRDETSPLLDPRYVYTQQYICQCGIIGCEYDERRISQEIDLIFGSWPRRLFNPKWWWWHIQPIVLCRCLDEPEDEY